MSIPPILLSVALLLFPDDGLSPPACHLLKHVRVLVGTGEVLESTDVLIRNGVIEQVGPGLEAPWDARVIDEPGLVVTPGFIDAFSTLLTPEPTQALEDESTTLDEGALWRMDPDRRKGLTPTYRVAEVLLPAAEAGSKHREVGFTTLLAVPHSAGLSGRSALSDLGSGVPVDQLLLDDVAMHLMLRPPRGGYPSTLMGGLAHLRQFLDDARHNREVWEWYRQNRRTTRRPRIDAAYQAALKIIGGEQVVVFEADAAREILTCLALAREYELQPYIAGGAEADRVAEELLAAGAVVLLGLDFPEEVKGLVVQEVSEQGATAGLQQSPQQAPQRTRKDRASDESKAPKKEDPPAAPMRALQEQDQKRRQRIRTASVLAEASVPFALTTRGLKDASEFPANLRLAVEAGLSREMALAALTFQAARVLGAGGVTGAVRPGLVANLAVFDGDPFDEQTRVKYVFVRGERNEIKHKPKQKGGGKSKAVDLTGQWQVESTVDGQTEDYTAHFEQAGETLTGSVNGKLGQGRITSGSVSAGGVSFQATFSVQGLNLEISFEATIDGGRLEGTATLQDGTEFEWTAVRIEDPQSTSARNQEVER